MNSNQQGIMLPRRDFLKRSAALATGVAAWACESALRAATSQPHLTFPTEPRARLAVASWPFRAYIESPTNRRDRNPKLPGMDLKEFPAMVVEKFGLHHIEPLAQHFASTEMSYVQELREAAEQAQVSVVDVPVSVRASFYDTDPRKRRRAVEAAKQWVDLAAALHSPSIRTNIEGPEALSPDVGRTAESLKAVAEYAAQKNVIVNLENDDNRTEDPFFLAQVLDKVNNPYLRALPDFCNSMLTHDQDFNNRAMQALFARAYNIAHVKDSEVGDNGKLYTVDVEKCFEIAKASGYRGYFSMEWEGGGDPYVGTRKLIKDSLQYLG